MRRRMIVRLMADNKTFGARVRALRKLRGLTQEELAAQSERSVDAISQIERGVNYPSHHTLTRLSSILGAPVGELLGMADADESPRRAAIYSEILELCRTLDDGRLDVAVEQLRALARQR
jgi:transcriptional regulator with XRE-family HTH domain